jgi:orotate phosphoribosyltransferase
LITLKNFDRIVGISLLGILFASQIAYKLTKPFLYMRKDTKLYGRERLVEGILGSGERVLLLDDLLITGLKLQRDVDSVRAEFGIVIEAVVFLDPEEGGTQLLDKNGEVYALL